MKRSRNSRTVVAQDFLKSLHADGADVSQIQFDQCSGGLGVFAAREIPSGCEVFRCPFSVVLTAHAALSDATIGEALRDESVAHLLDDHWRVILLLMQRRREGSAYTSSLPGLEFVHSLPLHWTEQEQRELLSGTALQHQAKSMYSSLRSFHDTVLCALCTRWPHIFPATDRAELLRERLPPLKDAQGSFGWEALCWAHGMFWSRAIDLDLPGGRFRPAVHHPACR